MKKQIIITAAPFCSFDQVWKRAAICKFFNPRSSVHFVFNNVMLPYIRGEKKTIYNGYLQVIEARSKKKIQSTPLFTNN